TETQSAAKAEPSTTELKQPGAGASSEQSTPLTGSVSGSPSASTEQQSPASNDAAASVDVDHANRAEELADNDGQPRSIEDPVPVESAAKIPLGETVTFQTPDGAATKVVIAPHDALHELLKLVGEIRTVTA